VRTPVLAGEVALGLLFGAFPARYQRFGLAGHDGVDFICPEGTQVYTPCEGRIIGLHDDPAGWGRNLQLRDVQGRDWYFCHLSSFQSSVVGDWVIATTPVALTGNTGNSDTPHLHVTMQPHPPYSEGLWRGRVDPLPFLLAIGATPF
jgi:murein DD-endopeptidase MepM/ murein hydrolase activator NlpD